MKIIEIENSKIANIIGYSIVLYPFILYKGTPSLSVKKHEFVHIKQIKENGIIIFYFKYIKDYLKNRINGMNHKDAYFNIPFEVEAYLKEKT